MRKLLLLALLLLFWPAQSKATPIFIQKCNSSAIGVGPTTCNLTVGAGHLLLVGLRACGPLPGITDSLGLSYAGVDSIASIGGTSCNFRQPGLSLSYACTGSSSGSDAYSFTGNPVTYSYAIIVAEFSGASCSLDGSGVSNTAAGTTGTLSGGNVTTSATGDLLVAVNLINGATAATPTVGTGYALIVSQSADWGGGDCGSPCQTFLTMEYKVAGAAGSYATDWTIGTNQAWGIAGGAFGGSSNPAVRHRAQVIRYRKPKKHKILLAQEGSEIVSKIRARRC